MSGGAINKLKQYPDGTVPTPPLVGTAVLFDEGGTARVVSDTAGLPIQGSVYIIYSLDGFTSAPTHATVSLTNNTDTTIIANPGLINRKMFMIQNVSTATVWIKLDGAAAAVNAGIALQPWDILTVTYPDFITQEAIQAIQNSGSSVDINVTYLHES